MTGAIAPFIAVPAAFYVGGYLMQLGLQMAIQQSQYLTDALKQTADLAIHLFEKPAVANAVQAGEVPAGDSPAMIEYAEKAGDISAKTGKELRMKLAEIADLKEKARSYYFDPRSLFTTGMVLKVYSIFVPAVYFLGKFYVAVGSLACRTISCLTSRCRRADHFRP